MPVDLAYDLVQQFAQMLRERLGERLDSWLTQVNQSRIPELQSFARFESRKTKRQ
jgi:transposase